MTNFLTANSTLMCPHGGQVSAVPSDTRVTFGGAPIVLQSDTFIVAGCPFFIGPSPHPCLQVQWIVAATRSTANGTAPLTTSSVGLCVAGDRAPQGPVQIVVTQPQVSGL
jgi:hypothetical protein